STLTRLSSGRGVTVDAVVGSSSSARPFLKDFTPFATSPIRSEILPLPPNRRSATAPNNIQCQMLKLPMAVIPLRAARRSAASASSLCPEPKRATRQKQACLHGKRYIGEG